MHRTPRVLALFVALALLLGAVGSVHAQAVITNGTITHGVNPLGDLNLYGGETPATLPFGVGLLFNPTGNESLALGGCFCEGWGVGVMSLGTSGWATKELSGGVLPLETRPDFNLSLQSFTATADSATSVVTMGSALKVTHAFHPSPSSNLYQIDVTIENISGTTLGDTAPGSIDLRYRRVLDWDVMPTAAMDVVTIGGLPATNVIFTSDDGFEVPDPLRFLDTRSAALPANYPLPLGDLVDQNLLQQTNFGVASPVACGFTVNFTQCGPYVSPFGFSSATDHGALFDLGFPGLGPGEVRTFTMFYGAAATAAEANAALALVGAEVFSFGQCAPESLGGDPTCDLTTGAPNTFIFALRGVDLGSLSGTLYADVNTPLSGVTVTLTRTDVNPIVVLTTTSAAANGAYTFGALPAGTYALSVGTVAGQVTPSPVTVSLARGQALTGIGFGFVAVTVTGSITGTAYTDVNTDGFFNGTDTPLSGVSVTLTGTDANGAVSRTTLTAANGTYTFGGLPAGTYSVSAPATVAGQTRETSSPMTAALGAGGTSRVDFGYLPAAGGGCREDRDDDREKRDKDTHPKNGDDPKKKMHKKGDRDDNECEDRDHDHDREHDRDRDSHDRHR